MAIDKKKLAIVSVVFIVTCFLSLSFFVFSADEYTYMNNADAFVQGNYSDPRFPLFPFIISVFYRIFGSIEAVPKALNLAIAALGIIATYFFAKKLFNEKIALWSALFLASNPFYIFFSTRVMTEPLFTTLLTACVFLIFLSEKNPRFLPAFGFALAVLVLTRYIGLYVLPIFLIYLWKNRKLNVLWSKWIFAGAAAFAAVFALYLWLSYSTTGNALGFILSFFLQQISVQQGLMSLPDKIPSYIIFAPFVAGALVPLFLMYIKDNLRRLGENKHFLPALSIVTIAVVMEIWGLFNFALFRYIAVTAPLIAIPCGVYAAGLKSKRAKVLVAALVAVNLAAGVAGVIWFNNSYPKHVDYRKAGLFAAEECNGKVFSNIDFVVVHYTKKQGVSMEEADCIIDSGYDGKLNQSIAQSFAKAAQFGKIIVYEKSVR
jgi:4-amino-4-deoxy-L-arabinose transferase-like glycosyltransferase